MVRWGWAHGHLSISLLHIWSNESLHIGNSSNDRTIRAEAERRVSEKTRVNTRAWLIKAHRMPQPTPQSHSINYLKRSQNHNKTASHRYQYIFFVCTQLRNDNKKKQSACDCAIPNVRAFFSAVGFISSFHYCCIISGTKSKVFLFNLIKGL